MAKPVNFMQIGLIVAVVMFLICGAIAYLLSSELTKLREELKTKNIEIM